MQDRCCEDVLRRDVERIEEDREERVRMSYIVRLAWVARKTDEDRGDRDSLRSVSAEAQRGRGRR
jgi:hypothetical protein